MNTSESSNRLLGETSPYLLQHSLNPVDWYPWCEEALSIAKSRDKPILLSIGYSACHWCHVMEHESFENKQIADLMNEHFVSIKVDREERPDLDEIYMKAVQIMTGTGGWPLTVFLTPDLKPFYGGTYFPPEDRWGRPGFKTVLKELHRAYTEQRQTVRETSEALTQRLQTISTPKGNEVELQRELLSQGGNELSSRFDPHEGGFSKSPKFPPSGALDMLFRHYKQSREQSELEMATLTLNKMAAGGMYDHLGGGFHRYSTDEKWLVPHFEKMLYDNALLVPVYLNAYQITGNNNYARIARECLEWVLNEMQNVDGGYYSTQDADSEGVEGKFYVWSAKELTEVLGKAAIPFAEAYGVSAAGNWEGTNILHLSAGLHTWSNNFSSSREQLAAVREKRVRPRTDDKVLTSWNGLMIVAMAHGYRVLRDKRFFISACRCMHFLESRLYKENRLLAVHRKGQSKLKGYLDDYAFLLAAYVALYESDFDAHWLTKANSLVTPLSQLFLDKSSGGFFFTGTDHEKLIARTKTGYDGAIPSGNAIATTYLLKLSEYLGSSNAKALAVDTLLAFHSQMKQSPSGFPQMMAALDFHLSEKIEVAIVGKPSSPEVRAAIKKLQSIYAPNIVLALLDPETDKPNPIPFLKGKTSGPSVNAPLFYVCKSYTCKNPTDDLEEVVSAIGDQMIILPFS